MISFGFSGITTEGASATATIETILVVAVVVDSTFESPLDSLSDDIQLINE